MRASTTVRVSTTLPGGAQSTARATVTAKFLMQYLAALSQRRVGRMKRRVEEERRSAVYARSGAAGLAAAAGAHVEGGDREPTVPHPGSLLLRMERSKRD